MIDQLCPGAHKLDIDGNCYYIMYGFSIERQIIWIAVYKWTKSADAWNVHMVGANFISGILRVCWNVFMPYLVAIRAVSA